MNFTIPLPPVTKKNSQQIRRRRDGVPFIAQSDRYRDYENGVVRLLAAGPGTPRVDYPVNVKALYYMPTRRRVDLVNLHSALHDVLVKAGVLVDDNSKIIVSTDGSRVMYDKENPRTEVFITAMEELREEPT